MKLDHIQLAMPAGQEDIARQFFVEILEMHEVSKPVPLQNRGGCWFGKAEVIIHIGVDKDFHPQKKAHPALCVTQINDLAARLKNEGFPVKWDDSLPERCRFYSEDPFGNRLEFIKDGDGFLQK